MFKVIYLFWYGGFVTICSSVRSFSLSLSPVNSNSFGLLFPYSYKLSPSVCMFARLYLCSVMCVYSSVLVFSYVCLFICILSGYVCLFVCILSS